MRLNANDLWYLDEYQLPLSNIALNVDNIPGMNQDAIEVFEEMRITHLIYQHHDQEEARDSWPDLRCVSDTYYNYAGDLVNSETWIAIR